MCGAFLWKVVGGHAYNLKTYLQTFILSFYGGCSFFLSFKTYHMELLKLEIFRREVQRHDTTRHRMVQTRQIVLYMLLRILYCQTIYMIFVIINSTKSKYFSHEIIVLSMMFVQVQFAV